MLHETRDGIIFQAKIKTKSKKFQISNKRDHILLEVKSPPVQGKANTEIVKTLKRMFGKEVLILKGFKSKDKLIFVNGITEKEFEEILGL